jgi:TonB family protein
MVKVALYMAAFYAVYTILLSRDTMYARNRIFILFSLLGSVILPFITLQLRNPINIPVFGKILSEVTITGDGSAARQANLMTDIPGMLLVIYLTGLAFFSAKLIADILSLVVMMNRQKNRNGNIIKFSNLYTSGFSAFGKVFINEGLTKEDAPEIIKHEQNHLRYNHFSDIIFIEILKAVQWFNPFIYLFDRSLRSGVPVVSYQQLILNQVFKSRAFTITNSFSNPTLIKKRMIMMTKTRSKTLANLKILMVLPVIAILLIAISSCNGQTKPKVSTTDEVAPPPPPPPPPVDAASSDQKVAAGEVTQTAKYVPPPPPPPPPFEVKNGDTTWVVVDEMPIFLGGDEGLLKFINENVNYPAAAKAAGIQGRIIIQFTVTKGATVNEVKVVRGVNPELDAEALRVVNKLVFEKPGYNHGKEVDVRYMLPITFALK